MELSRYPGDLKFVDNGLRWILLNNTLLFLIAYFSLNKYNFQRLQKRNNVLKCCGIGVAINASLNTQKYQLWWLNERQ